MNIGCKKVSYNGIYQDRAERRIRRNRERRARELRIKMVLFFTAIIVGAALAIILNSSLSNAKSGSGEMIYKYYQSYQIKVGDSLTTIAQAHIIDSVTDVTSYVKEVMNMNHLAEDDYLRTGAYLIIPYYSTEYKN